MLVLLPLVLAGDTWETVRAGVEYLHRTTSEPQDIHAARIDLSLPNVAVRASQPIYDEQQHVTTSTFARNVGALVAINGDWSDTVNPYGLAIGDGWQWHDHTDTWGFLGCDIHKKCELDAYTGVWWFTPTIYPWRFFNAVGANGVVLMRDGVQMPMGSGCYDSSDNPRSAACLEADGTHLWLVVVDGRQSDSAGMTCAETAALLADLGCWDAVMLDGGGSSTLYVDGQVKNDPSDGSERVVGNHFGVIYNGSADPACVEANGKWCEGTVIHQCAGGQAHASGDCAIYGASCQEDGAYAFCVDYRCPRGDGMGAACLDATRVASCTDGVYGEGDCGYFGLVCGEDAEGATCMDSRCAAGPRGSFCTDGGLYAACADGVYAESACEGSCAEDAAGAYCVDPRCPAADGGTCSGSTWVACERGVYGEQDCAATGLVCAEGSGCVVPAGDDGDTDPTGDPGRGEVIPGEGGCGCGTGSPAGWIAALAAVLVVRRRG